MCVCVLWVYALPFFIETINTFRLKIKFIIAVRVFLRVIKSGKFFLVYLYIKKCLNLLLLPFRFWSLISMSRFSTCLHVAWLLFHMKVCIRDNCHIMLHGGDGGKWRTRLIFVIKGIRIYWVTMNSWNKIYN